MSDNHHICGYGDVAAPDLHDGKNQIVLVFQGGGALGAYQAGVYQALHEAGVEPDWVIGTSIGAINASIVAGNDADTRIERLQDFWSRVSHSSAFDLAFAAASAFGNLLPNWTTVNLGVQGFFKPNPLAFLGQHVRLAPEAAGYYSTMPLRRTLEELVDFKRLGRAGPRLTVGAANVGTAQMRYFDSRDEAIDVSHIMASGALPPAFPAVRINGELYWDGGILSNTPVEAVFDDFPRRSSIIFAVHVWNPDGAEPDSILQVMNRQKDLQYSSRAATHIRRQAQLHRMRHAISELVGLLPPDALQRPDVQEIASHGCLTRMHVVRLLSPQINGEDHTKDIDFSKSGIRMRWEAGLRDARQALAEQPWRSDVDPREGFYLHELRRDRIDPAHLMDRTPTLVDDMQAAIER
ncbi:MAG: patatin-like phospholipase family protein [Methylobacteriaceae bacterium]|nr:patatin-like phospholipase family protein [Rhodoblastus sp.]MCC0005422.1 patatin-like phospholipase family protein [Methylobacteriaceae bacterium]